MRYGGPTVCWLGDARANLAVFGGPLAVVLLSNAAHFARTIWGVRQIGRGSSLATIKKHASRARMVKEELLIYITVSDPDTMVV